MKPLIPQKQSKRSSGSSPNDQHAVREVQRQFAAAVMTPLTGGWRMQARAADGRPMAEVVGAFVKPNDRLTAFQRIEIYNRLYWFRLIDIMYDDYGGVAAILGRKRFNRFCEAYLTKYPSRSGLLRNLGSHLVQFIAEAPEFTSPYTEMAMDMARREWAQVEAFDAPEKTPLMVDDLLGKDPANTRLALQPSITLLDLHFEVDELLLAVKKEGLRSEASNASDDLAQPQARRRSAKAGRRFIAVHRTNDSVFIKRLDPPAFTILRSLRDGATLAEAIEAATHQDCDPIAWPTQVKDWFAIWMSMKWFCRK